jgi:hypothetical protein
MTGGMRARGMRPGTLRRWIMMVLALAIAGAPGEAQRRGRRSFEALPNVPYDGRYTFVRISYDMGEDFSGGFGSREPPWAHDYPRGERHFTKIVSELSSTRTRTDASNIFSFDDPDLFKYPVAYMSEPGFWNPSESEVLNLRRYLAKGGFIIFDDFVGRHWMNFERQITRVLPDARPVVLTAAHPIFDSFYRITDLSSYQHPLQGVPSVFYGIYEDNDPSKRLVAIINYNNDLSELWEFSDEGMFPLDQSNEAYKLGVNYIVYALTR